MSERSCTSCTTFFSIREHSSFSNFPPFLKGSYIQYRCYYAGDPINVGFERLCLMPAPQHDQFNACTRIAAQCIFTPTDQGGFFFFNTWLMTPHVTSPRTLLSPPTAVILRGLSSNIVTTLTPQSSSSYTPPPYSFPNTERELISKLRYLRVIDSSHPEHTNKTERLFFTDFATQNWAEKAGGQHYRQAKIKRKTKMQPQMQATPFLLPSTRVYTRGHIGTVSACVCCTPVYIPCWQSDDPNYCYCWNALFVRCELRRGWKHLL